MSPVRQPEIDYGPLPEGARLVAGQGRILDRMTAQEVDLTSFTPRYVRPGYDEKEVDETFDRITVTLAWYESFLHRTDNVLQASHLTKREMIDLIRADIARLDPSLGRVPEPQAEASEAGTGMRDSRLRDHPQPIQRGQVL